MGANASTSRMQLAYAIEAEFGKTPAAGDHRALRFTGESLNFNLTKESSEEINEYRGSSSMITVDAEASGSVNTEVSFAEYDEFIAGTLQNSWMPFGTNGVGEEFEASSAGVTITAVTPPTGTSALTNLKKGQWFGLKVNGQVQLLRVSSTVAPTADTLTIDVNTPLESDFINVTVSILVSRISNGVSQKSYSIEKFSADTGEYFLYRGMTPGSMSLNIAQAARSTFEFAFMGKDADAGTQTALPGAKLASQGFPIMSGVDGAACALWYGGEPLTGTAVSTLALSYDNALRMQKALCSLGAIGVGSGTIAVTLDTEVYFSSGRAFYDEFLKNQNKEICFTSFDPEGNGYVFTLPKANVSTYSVTAGSRDTDLMASVSFTGLMELNTSDSNIRGKVLIIDRIGAPLVTG